jgi:hypothetical protein
MQSYLWDFGVEARQLGSIDQPEVLVLGRTWIGEEEEEKTRSLLSRRRGTTLRICSQEMVLTWSLTGVDPNVRSQTAETFVDGHTALEMVRSELEDQWPGTEPIPNYGNGSDGDFGPDKSPLHRLGYSVGQTGRTRAERRKLLRQAYEMDRSSLPGDYPRNYIEKWGPAESGKRLKRIADHLAANCRSFKNNRGGNYETAIDQWEADLDWLRRTFFTPTTYGFQWPGTE